MPDERAEWRPSSRVIASEQRTYTREKIGLDPARPVVRAPPSRRPEVRCRARKVLARRAGFGPGHNTVTTHGLPRSIEFFPLASPAPYGLCATGSGRTCLM